MITVLSAPCMFLRMSGGVWKVGGTVAGNSSCTVRSGKRLQLVRLAMALLCASSKPAITSSTSLVSCECLVKSDV